MARDRLKWGYADHKSRAKRRGILFALSYEQWLNIWTQSGKLDMRGRGANTYCMSRLGDMGGYEIGNVFIQSNAKNVSDAKKGRTQSKEHVAKRASSLLGSTYSKNLQEKLT